MKNDLEEYLNKKIMVDTNSSWISILIVVLLLFIGCVSNQDRQVQENSELVTLDGSWKVINIANKTPKEDIKISFNKNIYKLTIGEKSLNDVIHIKKISDDLIWKGYPESKAWDLATDFVEREELDEQKKGLPLGYVAFIKNGKRILSLNVFDKDTFLSCYFIFIDANNLKLFEFQIENDGLSKKELQLLTNMTSQINYVLLSRQ